MLTVEEAAAKAGVHVESVRRWIRRGELAAALPSRKKGYQIREEVLEQFLEGKAAEKIKGYIHAEKVLELLADEWKVRQYESYCRVAREVAKETGLLKSYQEEWDAWDGNMVDPDKDCKALYARKRYLELSLEIDKELDQENEFKAIEGKLILESFLTEEELYELIL